MSGRCKSKFQFVCSLRHLICKPSSHYLYLSAFQVSCNTFSEQRKHVKRSSALVIRWILFGRMVRNASVLRNRVASVLGRCLRQREATSSLKQGMICDLFLVVFIYLCF